MNKIIRILFSFFLLLMFSVESWNDQNQKSFVFIVPSFNNKDWYKRNLDSLVNQKHPFYRVIYMDDASTDGTPDLVADYVNSRGLQGKISLIRNAKRQGALANIYQAVHTCAADEIVVLVDGDDWLVKDPNILYYLNHIYRDSDPVVWLTYGQLVVYPGGKKASWARKIDPAVIKSNSFRESPWVSSHLRTFCAGLFQHIKKEDLLWNDKDFFPMAWDLAIMFPMLEMAGIHSRFISNALYIYNTANQLNDHKVDRSLQLRLDKFIRTKKKYDPIANPFLSGSAEPRKIGLCVTATKKYVKFLEPFLASCRKYFLKNHAVTYFVFTDQQVPEAKDVVVVPVEHKPWPYTTLLRFDNYYQARDLLLQMDYVFASDADMRFIADASDEILGERVATIHPGFYNKARALYSYEADSGSTACVLPHEGGKYYAGGFYGGSAQEFVRLLFVASTNIKKDFAKGHVAVWHDESHLNRYFIDHPPTVSLSPAYCYPESWQLPFKKILLALDKNHEEVRS